MIDVQRAGKVNSAPHRRIARIRSIAVAVALTLTVAACGSSAGGDVGKGGSKLEPLTLAYTTTGATTAAALLIGSNPQMCHQYGVALESKLIAATTAASTVSSGQVQIGRLGIGGFLQAGVKAPTSIVAVSGLAPIRTTLYASKDVSSIADVKGQTVGASAQGSITDLIMKVYLDDHGILPKDVKFTYAGTVSSLIGLGSTGKLKAFVGIPPLPEKASGLGIHPVADLPGDNKLIKAMSMGVEAVNASYLKSHPDAVKGALQCIARAQEMLRDDPASGADTLAGAANMARDVATSSIKAQKGSYRLVPFTAEDAQRVMSVLEKYGIQDFGDFDPAQMIDNSYMP